MHAENPPRQFFRTEKCPSSWFHGLIPLGRLHMRRLQRHFYYSLGLTNRFTPPCPSDPLVLATLLRQWQNLSFLTSGIPIRPFQMEFTIFTDASTQGGGAHRRDSQISGVWTHSERRLHINVLDAQGRQYHCCSLYQQTRWGHSYALLRLVVDLFLWLQTQDIAIRPRHIPGCLNIFGLWGTPVVDMFATIHNTHLPQFMSPVTEPQALAW